MKRERTIAVREKFVTIIAIILLAGLFVLASYHFPQRHAQEVVFRLDAEAGLVKELEVDLSELRHGLRKKRIFYRNLRVDDDALVFSLVENTQFESAKDVIRSTLPLYDFEYLGDQLFRLTLSVDRKDDQLQRLVQSQLAQIKCQFRDYDPKITSISKWKYKLNFWTEEGEGTYAGRTPLCESLRFSRVVEENADRNVVFGSTRITGWYSKYSWPEKTETLLQTASLFYGGDFEEQNRSFPVIGSRRFVFRFAPQRMKFFEGVDANSLLAATTGSLILATFRVEKLQQDKITVRLEESSVGDEALLNWLSISNSAMPIEIIEG